MVGIVVCEPMGCVVGVTDSPAQAQDRAEELAFRSEDLEGWMMAVVVPGKVSRRRVGRRRTVDLRYDAPRPSRE